MLPSQPKHVGGENFCCFCQCNNTLQSTTTRYTNSDSLISAISNVYFIRENKIGSHIHFTRIHTFFSAFAPLECINIGCSTRTRIFALPSAKIATYNSNATCKYVACCFVPFRFLLFCFHLFPSVCLCVFLLPFLALETRK